LDEEDESEGLTAKGNDQGSKGNKNGNNKKNDEDDDDDDDGNNDRGLLIPVVEWIETLVPRTPNVARA
jgi:hypothetical protein